MAASSVRPHRIDGYGPAPKRWPDIDDLVRRGAMVGQCTAKAGLECSCAGKCQGEGTSPAIWSEFDSLTIDRSDGSIRDMVDGWEPVFSDANPAVDGESCGYRADDECAGFGGGYRAGTEFPYPKRSTWPDSDSTGSPCERTDKDCTDVRPDFDGDWNCDPFEGTIIISRLDVEGASTNMAEMFTRAWYLLETNQDLVNWIMCLVYGGGAGCVTNTLEIAGWFRQTFTIRVTDATPDFYHMHEPCDDPAKTYLLLGAPLHMSFCSTTPQYTTWDAAWCCGTGPERLCALIDLASTIFHELTHWCGHDINRNPEQGVCSGSYLAGNAMKWALLSRYPQSMRASVCAVPFGDSDGDPDPGKLFFLDTPLFMGTYQCL